MKKLIRKIAGYVVGTPGIVRHLTNLEVHLNSKIDALEGEVARLRKELAETRAQVFADDRLPEVNELFSTPTEYFSARELETKLPKELFGALTGAAVLDLACAAGDLSQCFRKYALKSFLGLDASEALIRFAVDKNPDKRFAFRQLDIATLERALSPVYDLVFYMPTCKRFALVEFRRLIELGLRALAKHGKMYVSCPFPFSDLEALGFDILTHLEQAGYSARFEDGMVIISFKELTNVAVSQ